ncbi:flagellar hook-length control protein FliK [Variovorax sp. M-6]|uniref:flagellar hook-length control protein FliK n=1 Tax=Variovorax sp. M-6 TaxID=3233041 RepID=UPI003F950C1C
MSGLTGLIDALLAVRASPRLDVLAIKAEAQIGAPGAVPQVLKVENDVRLPSKAALDRVLPGGSPSLPSAAAAQQPPEAELSVAARVISAVLADLETDAGPVRGTAPAWPSRQVPSAPVLASALSQTVARSGLFYESHLVDFASGTRTLAQLMEEPQARWATPLAAQRAAEPAAATVLPVIPAAVPLPVATLPVAPAAATLAPPLPETAAPAADPEQGETASLSRAALPAAQSGVPADGAAPQDDAGVPADAARLQAAYGRGEAARPAPEATASAQLEESAPVHHAAASAARAVVPAAEVIHPQAVSLVHQQLDLLATAVFRWNGEAWPGVAMNWSVEKEAAEPSGEAVADDGAQRWSTTVSMRLPRLGEVDLRLSLAGPGLQARLAASEPSTVTALRADGGALVQRLEAAGLRVQDLQVAPMAPPSTERPEGAS